MAIIGEYIWIDGGVPTKKLRSKTKIITSLAADHEATLADFPAWQFDGSSTGQAEGDSSDCLLAPVRICPDPVRGLGAYLVLCEVMNSDGSPHPTNTRATLRKALDAGANASEAWLGFEQEYTLYDGSRPLGFPSERRYPAAQGPYYCGVGADEVYGRDLVEAHLEACVEAGLSIVGINAEVMLVNGNIKSVALAQDHSKPVTSCGYPAGCYTASVKKLVCPQHSIRSPYPATGMAPVCIPTFQPLRCARRVAFVLSTKPARRWQTTFQNTSQPTVTVMKCASLATMKHAAMTSSNTAYRTEPHQCESLRWLPRTNAAIWKIGAPTPMLTHTRSVKFY